MKIATIISVAIFFLVVVCPPGVFSEICQRLNPSLFQRCIEAGHNYTAYFPGNTTLHENIITHHIEREAQRFGQCSKYLDTILCSIFVPKCVEDIYSPILPCKRVCEDFVRDCELKVDSERIEWIKGLCRYCLLPQWTSATETNAFNRQIISREKTLQVSNKNHLYFLNINANLGLNNGFITDS